MAKSAAKPAAPTRKRTAKPKVSKKAAQLPEKSKFTEKLFQPVPLKEANEDLQMEIIDRDSHLAIREILHFRGVGSLLDVVADELEPLLTRSLPSRFEPFREEVKALVLLLRCLRDTGDFCSIHVYGDPCHGG